MPKKCVTKKMKEGLSKSAAVKACYNIPARGKGEADLRFSKKRKHSKFSTKPRTNNNRLKNT